MPGANTNVVKSIISHECPLTIATVHLKLELKFCMNQKDDWPEVTGSQRLSGSFFSWPREYRWFFWGGGEVKYPQKLKRHTLLVLTFTKGSSMGTPRPRTLNLN